MKTKIYTTFDSQYETWNAITEFCECVFYGTIDELEDWLEENSDEYEDATFDID